MTGLNVLIANEHENIEFLEQTLRQSLYDVTVLSVLTLDLVKIVQDSQPDILILNVEKVNEALLQKLVHVNRLCALPIVLFAEDPGGEAVDKVIKAGVSAYVVASYEAKRVRLIVETAIARFKERQALENELQKTKAKLEERKFIEKAKGILIKTQQITEDEAYHTLRKLAMERSVPIAEMAHNVISMASLLETKKM